MRRYEDLRTSALAGASDPGAVGGFLLQRDGMASWGRALAALRPRASPLPPGDPAPLPPTSAHEEIVQALANFVLGATPGGGAVEPRTHHA